MKRLLLPLLATIALPTNVEACFLGNCGSKLEAKNACNTWKKNGGTYLVYKRGSAISSNSYYEDDDEWVGYVGGQDARRSMTSITKKSQELRKCTLEEETRKFLGLQTKGVKDKVYKSKSVINKSYKYKIQPEIKWEVKKRFKY